MDKEQVVTTFYGSSQKEQAKRYYSAILSMMQSSGKDGYLKMDGTDVVFVETADPGQDIKPLQFPLSAIRNYKGYTEDESAKHCGVTTGKMKEFESDPGKMPASIAMKLRALYGIPIDYISM